MSGKKKIGKSLTCAYFHPFGLGGYSNSPLQPHANSKQFLYAWRLEMFKFIVRIIEWFIAFLEILDTLGYISYTQVELI